MKILGIVLFDMEHCGGNFLPQIKEKQILSKLKNVFQTDQLTDRPANGPTNKWTNGRI